MVRDGGWGARWKPSGSIGPSGRTLRSGRPRLAARTRTVISPRNASHGSFSTKWRTMWVEFRPDDSAGRLDQSLWDATGDIDSGTLLRLQCPPGCPYELKAPRKSAALCSQKHRRRERPHLGTEFWSSPRCKQPSPSVTTTWQSSAVRLHGADVDEF